MSANAFGQPKIDCGESICRLTVPIRADHWLRFVTAFGSFGGNCLLADVVITLDGWRQQLVLTVPTESSRTVSTALVYAQLIEIGEAMSASPESEGYGEALSAMASPRFSFLLDGLRLRRTADERVDIGIS
jgi:hypothetical protein